LLPLVRSEARLPQSAAGSSSTLSRGAPATGRTIRTNATGRYIRPERWKRGQKSKISAMPPSESVRRVERIGVLRRYFCSAETWFSSDSRPQAARAVALRLEQGAEQGIAVDPRSAAPDEAALAVDQGADLAIADRPKVEISHAASQRPIEPQRFPEPARDLGDSVEAPAGGGRPRRPDQDSGPAHRRRGGERMLVGKIVAHEDRTRAGEGGFRHQLAKRPAFVGAGGAKLGHHLAALDVEAEAAGEPGHEMLRLGGKIGREPIVKGHPGGLVLGKQSRPRRRELGDRALRLVQSARHIGLASRSAGQPKLEPVRAGKRDPAGSDMAVEIGDRPPADQRKPALQPFRQAIEKRSKIARNRIESGVSASSTNVPSKSRNKAAPSSKVAGGSGRSVTRPPHARSSAT
jgi:hypothetical protein